MRRILTKSRPETVSACSANPAEIELMKRFKDRCKNSGMSIQQGVLHAVREWMQP